MTDLSKALVKTEEYMWELLSIIEDLRNEGIEDKELRIIFLRFNVELKNLINTLKK